MSGISVIQFVNAPINHIEAKEKKVKKLIITNYFSGKIQIWEDILGDVGD